MRTSDTDEAWAQMVRASEAMAATPESAIAMCLRQGRTAVYVADDGATLVEHAPSGAPSGARTATPRGRG